MSERAVDGTGQVDTPAEQAVERELPGILAFENENTRNQKLIRLATAVAADDGPAALAVLEHTTTPDSRLLGRAEVGVIRGDADLIKETLAGIKEAPSKRQTRIITGFVKRVAASDPETAEAAAREIDPDNISFSRVLAEVGIHSRQPALIAEGLVSLGRNTQNRSYQRYVFDKIDGRIRESVPDLIEEVNEAVREMSRRRSRVDVNAVKMTAIEFAEEPSVDLSETPARLSVEELKALSPGAKEQMIDAFLAAAEDLRDLRLVKIALVIGKAMPADTPEDQSKRADVSERARDVIRYIQGE